MGSEMGKLQRRLKRVARLTCWRRVGHATPGDFGVDGALTGCFSIWLRPLALWPPAQVRAPQGANYASECANALHAHAHISAEDAACGARTHNLDPCSLDHYATYKMVMGGPRWVALGSVAGMLAAPRK